MEDIILNCSPTLAGIKCASIVSIVISEKEAEKLQSVICDKGLLVKILGKCRDRSIVLIYRASQIEKVLSNPSVKSFLIKYGYISFDCESALDHLSSRIKGCEMAFPHEIGIFLGYPLSDVEGFIENQGKDYLLCGYWKVYSDVEFSKNLFEKYRCCTNLYTKLYAMGLSIKQLAVFA